MHLPLPVPITPDNSAVVCIDLQEEHRSDPRYLVSGYGAVLAATAQVQQAARQAGMPVVHAGFRRDFSVAPPRPFEPLGPKGVPAFSDPDSPGVQFCAEVAPEATETVIWKNDLSCFAESGFAQALNGVAWVIICGVWAEACVAATVRDAIAAGLRVLLVKDAVGSGTQAMARVGVINLANRLYGGAVCDAAQAAQVISGAELPLWQVQGAAPLRFDAGTIDQVWQAL